MSDDDYAPGDEFNVLMVFCPPFLRDYARNLLTECNEMWADEIDDDTPQSFKEAS